MSGYKVSEPIKIGSLERYSRNIETIVKGSSKTETHTVTSRRDMSTHTVCEALVGDETGRIYLTLWDDDVDNVSEGEILGIKNANINIFRGSMSISMGREGTYESLEDTPFEAVNLENNLSDKIRSSSGESGKRLQTTVQIQKTLSVCE